jgi:TonB-linked SusC/RagA family outer membrane protein
MTPPASIRVTQYIQSRYDCLFVKPKHDKSMKFKALSNPTLPERRLITKTLRVMKLTSILFFLACLHVSARSYSQKVTLDEKGAPLEKIFREIKRQTGYVFWYEDKLLQNARKVDIHVSNATIKEVLDLSFAGQPLTYEIIDNTIVVKPSPVPVPQSVDTSLLPHPPIDINGHVTDSLGNPMAGASVTVMGTRKGTSTDDHGNFLLKGVGEQTELLISYTGYESRIFQASNGEIDVRLKAHSNSLLDVVVSKGYYSTSQRLNTGNVSTLSSEEIESQPVSNPLSALEGRVPGLLISQTTGMPGGFFNVQIRGQNSISNGNDPLYVVDGVPFPSQLLSNTNPANGGSSLNFINPADIDRIDILKDADATAIYGSRGANGVILITTKKGKIGKTKVGINVYAGSGKVEHFMDLLNTQQYLQMRNEAFSNDNSTPQSYNAPDLLVWDTTRYTNWQKELMGKAAPYSDAQIAISGGNINTQYSIGGGLHREGTVMPGNFADWKGSVHFNFTTISDNKKFKTLISANYVYDNNSLPADISSAIPSLAPDAPKGLNDDGSINWSNSTFTNNPYATLLLRYRAKSNNLVANAAFSYLILKSLELKISLGYNQLQAIETSVFPAAFFPPIYNIASGRTDFVNNNLNSWIVEPQLNYQIDSKYGKFSALLGSSIQESSANGQDITASNFPGDASLLNLQAAGTTAVSSLTNTTYKYNAAFGRLNYNWQDKYLLNFTARRDGSSRFGPDRQFQNFGALGAAWIFSNERSIRKRLGFLSFGKLRFSYGTSGNDQITDYRFLDLYSSAIYTYQGAPGVYPTRLYNPDLAWEQIKKVEGGLELGFVKDRVLLSASIYRNSSSNQLVGYSLPAITGFNSIDKNLPAVVQNNGLEFSLNGVPVRTSRFTWNGSFNISIQKNKLADFPDFSTSPYVNTYVLGQPLSIDRVFQFEGVDPQTGLYQFKGKDGKLTSSPDYIADRTQLVNTNPKFYGGFSNNFTYQGLSLSFFIDFIKKKGNNLLYTYTFTPPGAGYNTANWPKQVLQRWRQPGDISSVERFTSQAYGPANDAFMYAGLSDAAFTDASYIRLKNVAISYTLPVHWINSMHLQSLIVYLQGQNIWTITKYIGYNPETPNSIPALRVITAGIKLEL